jgi:transposase
LTSFPEILAQTEPGRKQVLGVEDWAEIRRLGRSEGLPIAEIARVMGISRNTVKVALSSAGPPQYRRRPVGSIVDGVEPRIRELLRAYPTMPATVIAERIGWAHGIRTLSGRVAELRPVYLPPDPVSRTTYLAGEITQCDLWVSRHRAAGGVRSDPHRQASAGADNGHRIRPLGCWPCSFRAAGLRTCMPAGGR